ncbi:MAG: MBL fold metallo-hydrolase, partial [Gammaproteobacteria bacterium]|nr:MBL fold metallo-hydrolase [Gammaproteobacteria bacterium]
MQIRFWGVRGSVPWATTDSIGHGCNTPCIEVRDARNGRLLILDAGSGIVGLGQSIGGRAGAIPILLTHYHWDH